MYELLKHCPSILSQSSHNFSISLASSHSLDAIVGLRHPLDRDISGANWKAGYGTGRTAAEDMLRKGIRSDNESLSPAAVFTGIHRHTSAVAIHSGSVGLILTSQPEHL